MNFLAAIFVALWTGVYCQGNKEIAVNDTVIGDPLMMVPILTSDDILKQLNATRLSLCFEIHGHNDETYNLVTSECVTVNAHYTGLTHYLNVIDKIGVRATNEAGVCRNIQVDVDGCAVAVDGVPLMTALSSGGISVRKSLNRVHISVPNCNDVSLVMWVFCDRHTLEDPFGGGEVTGDMLKFVVMRGLNFGHSLSHGLLGQFWNVPVGIEQFTGVDRNDNPVLDRYVINITSPFTGEERSYTGRLYDLTWSFEKDPCLYVGNRQAGPIYKVKDPNDPIIEGSYLQYMVPDLFNEGEFVYGLFGEDSCQPNPILS